jgi:hypothetical protein
LPDKRGEIGVAEVMQAPPGKERDEMIRKWAASVWEAYKVNREEVMRIARDELGTIYP